MSAIHILPPTIIEHRISEGLLVPSHQVVKRLGTFIIDCADDRALTEESFARRKQSIGEDAHSEGHFGGYPGIEIVGLLDRVACYGAAATLEFMNDEGPDFLTNVSAQNAALLKEQGVIANTHSDETHEKDPLHIVTDPALPDIGCAFLAELPGIIALMDTPVVKAEAIQLLEHTGVSGDIGAIGDNSKGLLEALQGQSVSKAALSYQIRQHGAPPPPILAGKHAPPEIAKIYLQPDSGTPLATHNYKHTRAGAPRYTHNQTLPWRVLPLVYPEEKFNADQLSATSLLLCAATAAALRGGTISDDLLQYEIADVGTSSSYQPSKEAS